MRVRREERSAAPAQPAVRGTAGFAVAAGRRCGASILLLLAVAAHADDRTSSGVFHRDVGDGRARCDGRSDDTAPLTAAIGAALSNGSGGAEIVLPPGRCIITRPLIVSLRPDRAISFGGRGMYISQLVQTGQGDGLVFVFSGEGNQSVYVHDLSLVRADPAARTAGRALALIGPDPSRHGLPVAADVIDRVDFHSEPVAKPAGGVDAARNWSSDITIQDVSNVRIQNGQIEHGDYGRGSERDIRIVSSSPHNRLSGNAVQAIVIDNENILGGGIGVSIEGNNIQGVFVLDSPLTAVGHAVRWDAGGSGLGFNGPLVVRDSSISAQTDGITSDGVSSLHVSGNLVIDGQPVGGTAWCGVCVDGTQASVVDTNVLQNLPNRGILGPGFAATGIRVGNRPDAYASVVMGNSIGPVDDGLVLSGPVAASNNSMTTTSGISERCYADRTQQGPHPTVTQNRCGDQRVDLSPGAPALLEGDMRVSGTLSVAGGILERSSRVPASSNAPCRPGEHAWDLEFEYRCVAQDRWRRSALSNW